ncbi:MAG: hypothetical protein IJU71_11100, partial [Selenomonadaceae bacterium]|nr:hypothetical protein [Selenomonadaceae bacterium]
VMEAASMDKEKITALMQDEAFVKELVGQEDVEDVRKLFASKGVELTVEQIDEIRKGVAARVGDGDEELSDDQLENVSGGFADAITGVIDAIIAVGDLVHTVTRRRW